MPQLKQMLVRMVPLPFVLLSLAGCNSGDGNEEKHVTLKVVYWDEPSFRQTYYPAIKSAYPTIDIDVISLNQAIQKQAAQGVTDRTEVYRKLLESEQPDVILLSQDPYNALADDGLLEELDTHAQASELDLKAFADNVLEALSVDGHLYGLAPSFNPTALYYNKDLFQKRGVEAPTGQMSWTDALQLAQRVAVPSGQAKDPVYGLYKPIFWDNLYRDLILSMGSAAGLTAYDHKGRMTVDGALWQPIWKEVVSALRTGAVYRPTPPLQPVSAAALQGPIELFKQGRIAMMEGDASLATQLQQGGSPRWDVVSLPADPVQRIGGGALGTIFAIPAESQHKDQAWKIVALIHSPSVMEELVQGELPSSLRLRRSCFNAI